MVSENGTIDTHDTLCSIIKDEVIVPDDYIDVCTTGTQNKQYLIFEEIEDITINSGDTNGESFVEICDSGMY